MADSPLQQDSFLFGSTITVDMGNSGINPETGEPWVGTPLANLASYANLVQRSIGQLLVNGGSIFLAANEVVGAPGSIINLTGGYTDFLGGIIHTTTLIGADGRKYSIGSADPNLTYVGIAGQFTVDHAHWGITDVYSDPLIGGGYYQPEYVQGGNAGTLTITVSGNTDIFTGAAIANSGAAILDSTILASAIAGQRQIAGGALPSNGTFNFTGILPIEIGDPGALSAPSLAASSVPTNFTPDAPLLATPGSIYTTNVFNSQMLNDSNFKNISFTNSSPNASLASASTNASITVDAGTTLAVQPGGSISLSGGDITVNGTLTARAGAIAITTVPVTPVVSNEVGVAGNIVIGPSAVLDVSGFFVNDRFLPLDQQGRPVLTNAGSISLVADFGIGSNPNGGNPVDLTGNITLAAGSQLNLEGGGHVLANGQLQTGSNGVPVGTGGNLTLATYQGDITPPTADGTPPTRGILTLNGTIDALGFNGGGTLTLQTVALQIGGAAATTPSYGFYFDPAFWGGRGFASFALSSVLQTEVPAGAIVRLTHQNLLPNPTINGAPGGADPAAYSTAGFLTGTLRSPTNLSISSGLEDVGSSLLSPSGRDDATVGAGAQILADPGASISLTSVVMTSVFGTISAPGGSISLSVTGNISNGPGPLGPVYLGPNSLLDVSGTTVINPLATPVQTRAGFVTPYTGQILPGGVVNLTDDLSPILVAPGATINVSGAAGAFDVAHLQPGGRFGAGQVVLTRDPVWSDAGQVNIRGANGLLFEGTLIGNPGAAQAAGGTLTITGDPLPGDIGSSIFLVQDTAAAVVDAGTFTGNPVAFDFATYVPTASLAAQAIDPAIPAGSLLVGASSINRSGFSSLILNEPTGSVIFAGRVSLNLADSFIANTGQYFASNAGNFVLSGVSGPRLRGGTTNGASLTVTAPYIAPCQWAPSIATNTALA